MSAALSSSYKKFGELSAWIDASDVGSSGERFRTLRAAIKAVSFNVQEYDAITPYSSGQYGGSLEEILSSPYTEERLGRILATLAVFIREATLVRDSRSDNEQVVLDYFAGEKQVSYDSDWIGYQKDYINHIVPKRLCERLYAEIRSISADINKQQSDAFVKVSDIESRIDGHVAILEKLKSKYNFVGLSDGFRRLILDKKLEKWLSFTVVMALGVLSVAVLLLLFFGWIERPLDSVAGGLVTGAGYIGWTPAAIGKLGAAIGIEVVVLYFFRISLRSYLLARSQITNLQLRLTLCTFIEGYVEFSGNAIKSAGGDVVSSFERIIFGALPSDDPVLPATIDGIEHMAKIIASARS